MFENYNLTEYEFIKITDETSCIFTYLTKRYKITTERKDMREMEYDSNLSKKWIKNMLLINNVFDENKYIPKDKEAIMKHIAEKYGKVEITVEKFIGYFNDFLLRFGISETEVEPLNEKVKNAIEILKRKDYLIFGLKKFKYYNYEQYDLNKLPTLLSLDNYNNVELSAFKFYNAFPEIMASYGIDNEYELYYLLKKILMKNPKYTFRKTPHFTIENIDIKVFRRSIVMEALRLLSPVSPEELSEYIEELYGLKKDTVLGWLNSYIGVYYANGVYSIDCENYAFNDTELSAMKTQLTEELYLTTEVERIFLKMFPNGNTYKINKYNLSCLGYTMCCNYLYKSKYNTSTAFFKHMLTDKNIIEISQEKTYIYNIVSFYCVLSEFKSRYEVIEYDPNKFIRINQLEKNNIDLEYLKQLCDYVAEITDDEEFFTIRSLKNAGNEFDIDKYGFSDWFISSIIREDRRFSSRRLGSTILLYKGVNEITKLDFLRFYLEDKRQIDIDDLLSDWEYNYGIKQDVDQIKQMIKDTEIYYNHEMNTIYANYDLYLEDL